MIFSLVAYVYVGQQYGGSIQQFISPQQAIAVQEKIVRLLDNSTGNAVGWTPNGKITEFKVADRSAKVNSVISIAVNNTLSFGITLHASRPGSSDLRTLALNPNTNLIYVANRTSMVQSCNSISPTCQNMTIIDGSTNTIKTVIGVPPNDLHGIALNIKTNKIYLLQSIVALIDGTNNKFERQIGPPLDGPAGIAVDSDHNKIYVVYFDFNLRGFLMKIDGATNNVTKNIMLPSVPSAVAVDSIRDRVFVASPDSNNLTVLSGSTTSIIRNIPVGDGPIAIAIDLIHDRVYVANRLSDDISVVDGRSNGVIATIPLEDPERPISAIAVDPGNNKIYVAKHDRNAVTVIDSLTNSVIRTIPVGRGPSALDFDPITDRLYVASSGEVNVMDALTNSLLAVPANLVICGVSNIIDNAGFTVECTDAPAKGAEINYLITTP